MSMSDELEEIRNRLSNQVEDIKSAWMEVDSEITLGSISYYVNSTLYNTIIGVKEYGNCVIKKSNAYDLVHSEYKVKARKTLVECDSLSNHSVKSETFSRLGEENNGSYN